MGRCFLKLKVTYITPAFSLVELLVVIACGGSLILAGIPSLHQFQREWSLWSSAYLLQSSLAWGRMHAISSNSPLMLQVGSGGRSIQWSDPESGEVFSDSVRYLSGDTRIVASPRRPLRFYPRGNAAPAGTYRVQNECGTFRVVVNIEGRIRVARE